MLILLYFMPIGGPSFAIVRIVCGFRGRVSLSMRLSPGR
jgi:hypothetical protein